MDRPPLPATARSSASGSDEGLDPAGDDPDFGPSIVDAPLAEGDAIELARVLAALADPVRLRLISLVASYGELSSTELERPLDRSQPTVSHHTRVLSEAGLLIGERRGRWMWWRIDPEGLAAIRAALGK
jgi:ArsR family transcriptional regulator